MLVYTKYMRWVFLIFVVPAGYYNVPVEQTCRREKMHVCSCDLSTLEYFDLLSSKIERHPHTKISQ